MIAENIPENSGAVKRKDWLFNEIQQWNFDASPLIGVTDTANTQQMFKQIGMGDTSPDGIPHNMITEEGGVKYYSDYVSSRSRMGPSAYQVTQIVSFVSKMLRSKVRPILNLLCH